MKQKSKWEIERNKLHSTNGIERIVFRRVFLRHTNFLICSEWFLPSSFLLFNKQIPSDKLSQTICPIPSVLTEKRTPSMLYTRGYRFHITSNSMIHQFKLSKQTKFTNSEICNSFIWTKLNSLANWEMFQIVSSWRLHIAGSITVAVTNQLILIGYERKKDWKILSRCNYLVFTYHTHSSIYESQRQDDSALLMDKNRQTYNRRSKRKQRNQSVVLLVLSQTIVIENSLMWKILLG